MKTYYLTAVPFILGILCFVLYQMNGVEVAADGTLIESFYYIPLGYLCFAIGILTLIIQLILKALTCFYKPSA